MQLPLTPPPPVKLFHPPSEIKLCARDCQPDCVAMMEVLLTLHVHVHVCVCVHVHVCVYVHAHVVDIAFLTSLMFITCVLHTMDEL